MASSARPGLPTPFRWGLCLTAGVVTGLAVGFAVGLARPRQWPDPVAPR
ncbi:MAG: hypothetical protein ACRYG2_33025 [Janthinobacterium lividum]